MVQPDAWACVGLLGLAWACFDLLGLVWVCSSCLALLRVASVALTAPSLPGRMLAFALLRLGMFGLLGFAQGCFELLCLEALSVPMLPGLTRLVGTSPWADSIAPRIPPGQPLTS